MLADYLDQVTVGDCLQVLADIPENSVDMCFADPPFNLEKNIPLIRIVNRRRNIWIGAGVG